MQREWDALFARCDAAQAAYEALTPEQLADRAKKIADATKGAGK